MSGLVMVSCAAEDKKSGPLFSEQEIREYQVRAAKDVPYLVMKEKIKTIIFLNLT